jgi:hypothetical protein
LQKQGASFVALAHPPPQRSDDFELCLGPGS